MFEYNTPSLNTPTVVTWNYGVYDQPPPPDGTDPSPDKLIAQVDADLSGVASVPANLTPLIEYGVIPFEGRNRLVGNVWNFFGVFDTDFLDDTSARNVQLHHRAGLRQGAHARRPPGGDRVHAADRGAGSPATPGVVRVEGLPPEPGLTPPMATQLDDFVALSAAVTGFTSAALLGTGMADQHYEKVRASSATRCWCTSAQPGAACSRGRRPRRRTGDPHHGRPRPRADRSQRHRPLVHGAVGPARSPMAESPRRQPGRPDRDRVGRCLHRGSRVGTRSAPTRRARSPPGTARGHRRPARSESRPPMPDVDVDVVIVGAGITGSAIARRLAAAHYSVMILEAGEATGTTWASYQENVTSRRRPPPRCPMRHGRTARRRRRPTCSTSFR